ncbi:MAG: hypothetical protein ABL986_14470 [Vicinamibacterales bacterium]
MTTRLRWLVPVLVLSALATDAAAQADAFRDGIRARNDRRWAEAATRMRAAIQENATESTEKVRITGLAFISFNSVEYLPHYFLGEALFNGGDCVAAVTAWEESERQGAVRSKAEFVQVMRGGYAACAQKGVLDPPTFQPLVGRAQSALAEATAARTRVAERNSEQDSAWRRNPSLQEQFETSRADFENAQARLAAGRRTRSAQDLNDARTSAERARDGFDRAQAGLVAAVALMSELQGQLVALERAVNDAEAIDRAIDPILARSPGLALPAAALAARATARDAVSRARAQLTRRDAVSPSALPDVSRSVQDAVTSLTGIRQQAVNVANMALEGERQRALGLADESLAFAQGGMANIDRVWTDKRAALGPEAEKGRDAARRQYEAATRTLTAARRSGDLDQIRTATRSLAGARRLIDSWITDFAGVVLTLEDRGVPAALVTASRHYFAGEYQSSLDALGAPGLVGDAAPLRVHVHLFRAGALFALYVRSGERSEPLRAQAAAEVARCKEIDPTFRPDSRAFGLRFLAFYDAPSPVPSQPPARQ